MLRNSYQELAVIFLCPNVCSLTLMFNIFIWLSYNNINYFKSCFQKYILNFSYFKKMEINFYLVIKKVVKMNNAVTNVKCKKQFSFINQNSFNFFECSP